MYKVFVATDMYFVRTEKSVMATDKADVAKFENVVAKSLNVLTSTNYISLFYQIKSILLLKCSYNYFNFASYLKS